MKKIIYVICTFVCISMLIPSCEIDNFPAPNSTFFGAVKDSVGGGLVEQDLINGSGIEVFELGYATQVSQNYVIKNNGEFRNDLVFSNNYDIYLRNGNFFPYTISNFTIKPGDNQYDFMVVPYIRVKNCSITKDQATNKIIATFTLEAGKPTVKVKSVRLYAFTDIYVGDPIKFTTVGTGFSIAYTPSKVIDGATITLSIDLATNSSLFLTGRDYFFRVGALADLTGVGTIRTNYAPYVKITL